VQEQHLKPADWTHLLGMLAPGHLHPMTYPPPSPPMAVASVCLLSDDGEGGHI